MSTGFVRHAAMLQENPEDTEIGKCGDSGEKYGEEAGTYS